ncbi:MAG: pyruvate kinase [Actinomycetota bacterium]
MRRAKIVCTLGPATSSPDRIRELVNAGMDVARLNLSHGSYEDHEKSYTMVRQASEELDRNVAIMVDLQGPKIRLGVFPDGPVLLEAGDIFVITTEQVEGTKELASTTYAGLPGDVRPGDRVLIDDGKVSVEVVDVTGPRVTTRVVEGGPVSSNKGLNLPGVAVSVPAMSDKDERDLRWALHLRADFIALSFVRSAADVDDVRRVMREEGVMLPVLAKIEKPQAVDNLHEIVMAFDGVMVARGDLGVELPLEQVPLVQKQAVEIARRNAKPVIVATQVLESMIDCSRPTRAEASDAANAVLDGADAIMLSGETSVGRHPIEAVRTMARIIANTEDHGLERIQPLGTSPKTKGGAITLAAATIGEQLGVRYLVTFTQGGDSARRMARLRSPIAHLVFTPEQTVRNHLAMTWGAQTFLVSSVQHTDEMALQVDEELLKQGVAERGDVVIIVAGSPPGIPGSTNALRVHRVGDAVDGSAPAYRSALNK